MPVDVFMTCAQGVGGVEDGRAGAMASLSGQVQQDSFAAALAGLLRQSRRRQGLTQAEVSLRTGGVVSKPALANYETGHRSLRVEIFWAIARALDENPGDLFNAASDAVGMGGGSLAPIAVDMAAINASTDPRLALVRRWFALRAPQRPAARIADAGAEGSAGTVIVLDEPALAALAALMGVSPQECRVILTQAGQAVSVDPVSQATQAALAARLLAH